MESKRDLAFAYTYRKRLLLTPCHDNDLAKAGRQMPSPSSPLCCAAIIGHQQFGIKKVGTSGLTWHAARRGLGRENVAGAAARRAQLEESLRDCRLTVYTKPSQTVGQLKSSSPDFEPVCQALDLLLSEASGTALSRRLR